MDSETVEYFKKIGLNSYEAAAYFSLVKWGMLNAKQVAKYSNIPTPKIYSVLDNLERKGFVLEKPGRPVFYKSTKPKQAIKKFVKHKTDELQTTESKLIHKLEDSGGKYPKPTELIWSVEGRGNVYTELERMMQSAKKHIYIIKTENGAIRLWKTHRELCKKSHERGVRIRLIVPITKLTSEYIQEFRKYMDVRHLDGDKINVRMMSFDRKQVLLFEPVPDDTELEGNDTGIMLGGRYAKFQEDLFDLIWENLSEKGG
ncbi:MAG: hypothetical protein L6243_05065 [Candidatus Altiarchaeales archaeon]|nr:hypothetical protein [Candidatus Altiarchaeota archaeon]MBU4341896.1 hypothetical protein [Candidatus Altiarchaeota archaeon]MCG2782941.1 hypothetical protein [Candidatus Altiarchaeales archaeon]